MQIISHNPAVCSALDVCHKTNDEVYEEVKSNPSRFAGIATLPMGDPSAAAEELTRCVKELGFVGALITNHANGKFYDDGVLLTIF